MEKLSPSHPKAIDKSKTKNKLLQRSLRKLGKPVLKPTTQSHWAPSTRVLQLNSRHMEIMLRKYLP